MSAAPTLKSGHLLKQGGGKMKVYQKRYFLLRGSQLYWFKRQGDVQHAGSLLLKTCCLTRYADRDRYLQLDGGEKVYHLKAEDKQTADEWVEALALAGALVTLSYGSGKETSSALQRLRSVGSNSRILRSPKPRPTSATEGIPRVVLERKKRTRSFSETDAERQPGSRVSSRLKQKQSVGKEQEEEESEEEREEREERRRGEEKMAEKEAKVAEDAATSLAGSPCTPLSSGIYMAAIPAGVSPVFERHRSSLAGLPASLPCMQMPVMCSSTPVLQQAFLAEAPLSSQSSLPVLHSLPQ